MQLKTCCKMPFNCLIINRQYIFYSCVSCQVSMAYFQTSKDVARSSTSFDCCKHLRVTFWVIHRPILSKYLLICFNYVIGWMVQQLLTQCCCSPSTPGPSFAKLFCISWENITISIILFSYHCDSSPCQSSHLAEKNKWHDSLISRYIH